MTRLIILFMLTYFIGAIPTSYLLGKWLKGIDIREHGSGNVGGTNAFRVLGPVPGIATLFIDLLKGFLPVFFLTPWLCTDSAPIPFVTAEIITGLFAIIGHVWPVYLQFKGGKGVATAGGVLFALVPIAASVSFAAIILMVVITRYVSVGSITGAVLIPVTLALRKFVWHHDIDPQLLVLGVIIAVTVIITHRMNIRRLLKGEERQFWGKKD